MFTVRALRPTLRAAAQLRSFHSTARRNDHFLNADSETLLKAIDNKEKIVLVDFYADWCGPCKMLSPILEKLTTDDSVKTGSGKALDLVTIDTDAQVELAQGYGIASLPTVIAFSDGKPISHFMGALPEPSVRKFLKTL